MEPFFYHNVATLAVGYTQAKSEQGQAYIVLTSGLFGNNKRKSSRISMKKVSTASMLSNLSLSTR